MNMSVSVSVCMEGGGRGVYMVCGFAGQDTCDRTQRKIRVRVTWEEGVYDKLFYTPVSRLSTRAARASGLRAPRHARSRGPGAPPLRPPLCCLQRAARPAAPLYFIDVSALSRSLSRARGGRSARTYTSRTSAMPLSRTTACSVLRTRYTRLQFI